MTADLLEPHLIDALSDCAREIFETMVSMTPSSIEPLSAEATSFREDVIGLLGFTGTTCGTFVVRTSERLAVAMAAKMLMMEADEMTDSAEVVDAFGELVNMLGGNFKNVWVEGGNVMQLSVPMVILDGEVNVRQKAAGLRSGIRVMVEGEPVDIGVHFEK